MKSECIWAKSNHQGCLKWPTWFSHALWLRTYRACSSRYLLYAEDKVMAKETIHRCLQLSKQKLHLTKLTRPRWLDSKILQRMQAEFITAETKGRTVFKSWGGRIVGHLHLLIGLTQRKSKLSLIFMAGDVFYILE